MNKIEHGIFITGQLIGIKQGSYTNRQTGEVFPYTALGISLPFLNSFNQQDNLIKEIRIGKDKLNDASFMKALSDNCNAIVKLEIGVGDYKNLYVTKGAILEVVQPAQDFQKAS